LTLNPGKGFPGKRQRKRAAMTIPTQIVEKLAAAGASPAEVEERFVRGSGPGGQKINKTSSTVWLRHRPTGLEVRCQRERSQAANRELAWSWLCAKLAARRAAAASAAAAQREADRRRSRQKSRGQKAVMVEAKRRQARLKSGRSRFDWAE
jgi:peptide chain release factor